MGYKSSMEPNLVNPWLWKLLWDAYNAGFDTGEGLNGEYPTQAPGLGRIAMRIEREFEEWLSGVTTLSQTGDCPEAK